MTRLREQKSANLNDRILRRLEWMEDLIRPECSLHLCEFFHQGFLEITNLLPRSIFRMSRAAVDVDQSWFAMIQAIDGTTPSKLVSARETGRTTVQSNELLRSICLAPVVGFRKLAVQHAYLSMMVGVTKGKTILERIAISHEVLEYARALRSMGYADEPDVACRRRILDEVANQVDLTMKELRRYDVGTSIPLRTPKRINQAAADNIAIGWGTLHDVCKCLMLQSTTKGYQWVQKILKETGVT